MKLGEVFKKLGMNLDEEIDETSTETVDSNDKEKDKEKEDSKKQEYLDKKMNIIINQAKEQPSKDENKTIPKEDNEVKAKDIKFDVTTGLFDLTNIDDADLKAVLKQSNDTVKSTANKVKIDNAISTKINSLKLVDGITTDVISKMLDTSSVKVNAEGTVVGVDEAVAALQKAQSGLFKKEDTNKDNNQNNQNNQNFFKQSTPMTQGFNPQQVNNDHQVIGSIYDAFEVEAGNS